MKLEELEVGKKIVVYRKSINAIGVNHGNYENAKRITKTIEWIGNVYTNSVDLKFKNSKVYYTAFSFENKITKIQSERIDYIIVE